MRLAFALILVLLLIGSPAIAQPLPIPQSRTGSCPWGYIWSAGQCVPSGGRSAPLAIERKGSSCPSGWIASGKACIKDQEWPRPR
jgi:hypothetical protein